MLLTFNETLGVYTWNLPAGRTCPGKSAWCRKYCYAGKGNFRHKSTQKCHQQHFIESQKADFVEKISEEIIAKKIKILRIHSSGDIYSVKYGKKLISLIKSNPTCKFYLYTRIWRQKRFHAILRQLCQLQNCTVLASLDPTISEIVPSFLKKKAYLEGTGRVNCKKQLEKGEDCISCKRCLRKSGNVVFRKH